MTEPDENGIKSIARNTANVASKKFLVPFARIHRAKEGKLQEKEHTDDEIQELWATKQWIDKGEKDGEVSCWGGGVGGKKGEREV